LASKLFSREIFTEDTQIAIRKIPIYLSNLQSR